jgi:hypothetical protein
LIYHCWILLWSFSECILSTRICFPLLFSLLWWSKLCSKACLILIYITKWFRVSLDLFQNRMCGAKSHSLLKQLRLQRFLNLFGNNLYVKILYAGSEIIDDPLYFFLWKCIMSFLCTGMGTTGLQWEVLASWSISIIILISILL